jgi:hypothetical protein
MHAGFFPVTYDEGMAANEASTLYDRDFFEWTRRNSELLRHGCFTEADMGHIAEEIADMGSRDQREVRGYLIRLLLHLLKWKFQPELRPSSWRTSIVGSRIELEGIFEQSPSLERHARELVEAVYPRAVRVAVAETGLSRTSFPKSCPYTFDQIMDDDFLPSSRHES